MTCRIAAREYTFEKFAEVEVADFDDQQISTFATKWFKDKAVKAESFIRRLKDNNRIKEIATNPLLLTLLCLVFEESGDFPANRSELYKEGLEALLKKWDAKRGIQRDQVYKKLSVQRKEELLSKIALTTFKRGDYFFKQKAVEQYIIDYIRNLPDANTDPEALQLDSEVVLRSIEAQHGLLVERAKNIYSFSHLTFHEYFTAREIVFGTQSLEEALQNLVSHITEKRWREVFLLAVGMSPSADPLLQLMQQQADALVYPVRAHNLDCALALDLALNCVLTLAGNVNLALDLEREFALKRVRDLDCTLDHALALEPDQALQDLKEQLPDPYDDTEILKQWWKANGKAWTEQLKAVMIKYRSIEHDWQFSDEQKKVLKQYYDANKLLVECLNSDCYVSREVRQEIVNTLLLPIAEIENRKHG